MHRRSLKLLSLWILPLLIARMLIPAGFMLMANAGGLSLMFCQSGVVQISRVQQTDHAGHHAGMHQADAEAQPHAAMHPGNGDAHASHSGASHNQDNAPCPFSLVASAAPSAVLVSQDASAVLSDERFDFISTPNSSVGPPRADRIRGPPAHA